MLMQTVNFDSFLSLFLTCVSVDPEGKTPLCSCLESIKPEASADTCIVTDRCPPRQDIAASEPRSE